MFGIVPCLSGIVALVLGFVARSQIKKSNGAQKGSGLALAGIILGAIWLVAIATGGVLYSAGVFDDVGVDVPSRSAFVTKVSDAIEADPTTQFSSIPAAVKPQASQIFDKFADCSYDVLNEQPRVLAKVYENPNAQNIRVAGVTQSEINKIEDKLAATCTKQLQADVAKLAGGRLIRPRSRGPSISMALPRTSLWMTSGGQVAHQLLGRLTASAARSSRSAGSRSRSRCCRRRTFSRLSRPYSSSKKQP